MKLTSKNSFDLDTKYPIKIEFAYTDGLLPKARLALHRRATPNFIWKYFCSEPSWTHKFNNSTNRQGRFINRDLTAFAPSRHGDTAVEDDTRVATNDRPVHPDYG